MSQLSKIPDLDNLVELGRADGVDIRPTLLRVMTDLYVQAPTHSAEDERHFTDLALRLIELVDPDTRGMVADMIAAYPNAPTALRQRLLREKIVLGPPPAADTSDPAENRHSDAAADELSELFFAATAEERRLILLNLLYASLKPAEEIPEADARKATDRLGAAALGHNTESFLRELERTLRISREHARRIVDDQSGEPVVVVAVALGMPAAVLQRILLCLNPTVSRSVQLVYELAVLHEEIEREAALRLLAIWQISSRNAEPAISARAPAATPPQPRRTGTKARDALATRPTIRWEEHAKSRLAESA